MSERYNGDVIFASKQINRLTGEDEGWTFERHKASDPVYGYDQATALARNKSGQEMWNQFIQSLRQPENYGLLYNDPLSPSRGKLYHNYGFADFDFFHQVLDNRVHYNPRTQKLLGLGDNLFLSPRENAILQESRELLVKNNLMRAEDIDNWKTATIDIKNRGLFELPTSTIQELTGWW